MTTLTDAAPDLSADSPLLTAPAEPPAVETATATPAANTPATPATKPEAGLGTRATQIRNKDRRLQREAAELASEKANTDAALRARGAELSRHQPTIARAMAIVQLAKTDAIGLLRARGLSDEQIQGEILRLAAPPDPRTVAEQRLQRAERALAEGRKEREGEKYDAAQQEALSVFVKDTRTTAAEHPALTRALAAPNGESEIRRRSLEIAREWAHTRNVELTDPQIRKLLEKEVSHYFRTEDAKKPKPAPKAPMVHDVLTMTEDQLKRLTLEEAARMGADERAADAEDEPAEDPLLGRDGKLLTREEELARLDRAIRKATKTETDAPKFRRSRVDGTFRRNAK